MPGDLPYVKFSVHPKDFWQANRVLRDGDVLVTNYDPNAGFFIVLAKHAASVRRVLVKENGIHISSEEGADHAFED